MKVRVFEKRVYEVTVEGSSVNEVRQAYERGELLDEKWEFQGTHEVEYEEEP